mmetsp:Transcript_13336/g.38670  ORF Transcript_13336/g.38670 Transcript_13336/m.38670 type:complete len:612 (+) Transcript_13336:80-1915(+)
MKLAWCVVALLLPFASAQLEGVGNPAALDRYIQNGLNEANSLLSHQNEILRVANGIIGSPSDAPGLLPEEGETCDGSCSASEEILEIHAVDEGEDDFEITEAEGLNEYQLIKVRQRGARRNHVQTGLGTRIKDVTAKEAVLDVVGKAHSACKQSHSLVLKPYLQSAGSTRMTVRWRTTGGKGKGVVCFGTSPEEMTSVVKEDGLRWPKHVARKDVETWDTIDAAEHQIVLDNLDPHTTYYYTVGSEIVDEARIETRSAEALIPPSRYYSFTTFPQPKAKLEDPIRVWAIGDSGWGDHKAGRVRDAFSNFTGGDWDLTLGLGDLAYLRGKDWEYQKRFFNYLAEQNARVPVFTTPGNHDAFTADMKAQTGPYFELFTNPGDGKSGGVASHHKSYYSFDYGPIHFVSVDSHHLGLHDDPTLYEWLEKDLAQAQRGNYSWIVAYHHQPPYSKGSHDSDAQYECYKLRQNLVPMFEKYGVDLVLAGHSHSYERSHLLNGHFGPSHEAATNPSVIKSRWAKDTEGVDTLLKSECGPNSGTVYIVTGGGAIRGGGSLDHPAMAFSHKNRGSSLLEFDDNELRIWLLGEHRDDKDDYAGYNNILDEAVIKKTGGCINS